jgi:myo-inositol-1(or 4)-monophosphatase
MRTLGVARQAAKSAGELIARYFRDGVTMSEKGPGNLVSIADIEAEKTIARVIHEAFPDHAIIGEEGLSAPADS